MKKILVWLLCGGMSACAAAQTRAAMDTFQIPSHGSQLNALAYIAAGAEAHPVVVLLHGFPGNEKNLDLAQDIRRAGWDVVYFNYRGSWGTPGDFSFSHCIEDVAAVTAYLRQSDVAKRLRLDPARMVLVGHSMGGFMTVEATAADPKILGMVVISGADMTGWVPLALPTKDEPKVARQIASSLADEGMAPLAGCTPQGLAQELIDHSVAWNWESKVPALRDRPALIITSDDGLAKGADALVAALKQAQDERVIETHFATDHPYSDKRLELSAAVVKWLSELK